MVTIYFFFAFGGCKDGPRMAKNGLEMDGQPKIWSKKAVFFSLKNSFWGILHFAFFRRYPVRPQHGPCYTPGTPWSDLNHPPPGCQIPPCLRNELTRLGCACFSMGGRMCTLCASAVCCVRSGMLWLLAPTLRVQCAPPPISSLTTPLPSAPSTDRLLFHCILDPTGNHVHAASSCVSGNYRCCHLNSANTGGWGFRLNWV